MVSLAFILALVCKIQLRSFLKNVVNRHVVKENLTDVFQAGEVWVILGSLSFWKPIELHCVNFGLNIFSRYFRCNSHSFTKMEC